VGGRPGYPGPGTQDRLVRLRHRAEALGGVRTPGAADEGAGVVPPPRPVTPQWLVEGGVVEVQVQRRGRAGGGWAVAVRVDPRLRLRRRVEGVEAGVLVVDGGVGLGEPGFDVVEPVGVDAVGGAVDPEGAGVGDRWG